MHLRVVYFASLRDSLGVEEEPFFVHHANPTVDWLRNELMNRGGAWTQAMTDESIGVSVNHTIARPGTRLNDGDEVAFFPPVSGG